MIISPARPLPFRFVLAAVLAVIAVGAPLRAEDDRARAQRLDDYIAALDTGAIRRGAIVDLIYTELRGPHAREMHELLLEALSRPNTLILQGVVQALAMLGDTADVAELEALLATTDKTEVRLLILRLLPAFCLPAERARFIYINYAVGQERIPRPEIFEPLRRLPLTRRGRLDPELERLQGRIIRSIASQFDPVGAALAYIDDVRYGRASRQAIRYLLGDALGRDPGRWTRIWAAQGADIGYVAPDEVEELRLAALNSLSDMGAEGLPEVVAALRMLEDVEGEVLPQAGFETMQVMCRTAFEGYPALASVRFGADDRSETENWIRRRIESTGHLAIYTARRSGAILSERLDSSVFHAAALALGAALSYPEDFPDPAGILAEEKAHGLVRLERLLMLPDISRDRRASVVLALGELATNRAVAAIAAIIDSPYCSAAFGEDGTRLTEAAIDALRNAAVGNHEGREQARRLLLRLLSDERMFTPLRSGAPPVGLAHMVLWRLQRLARTNDIIMDPAIWRERLDWE